MKLDDELKREGRMLFEGEENAGVPEYFYRITSTNLAKQVLDNENVREFDRLSKSRLLAKQRKRPASVKSAALRRSAKSETSR
jgi:hypothetical protein